MTKKPFDLEAVKRGEEVVQENGLPAKYVGEHTKTNTMYPLVFEFQLGHGTWMSDVFTKDGRRLSGKESENDIFMAPKKLEWWVRSYRNPQGGVGIKFSDTEWELQTAEAFTDCNWLSTPTKIWEGEE